MVSFRWNIILHSSHIWLLVIIKYIWLIYLLKIYRNETKSYLNFLETCKTVDPSTKLSPSCKIKSSVQNFVNFCYGNFKMCIAVSDRLDFSKNEQNTQTFFGNNEPRRIYTPPRFTSQNKQNCIITFPIFLIYAVIVKTVIYPNVDKSSYLNSQNVLLLCTLLALYFLFRPLNNIFLAALNMTPSDPSYIISGDSWFIKFVIWIKHRNQAIHSVLLAMLFVSFVAQFLTGIVLVVRFLQK